MTTHAGTHLAGLDGTNPLGFLASLGVQVAFAGEAVQPRLWWSDDITPHAVVDTAFTVDRIVDRALEVFAEWRTSPAMNPVQPDGSPMKKGAVLKLAPEDLRQYVRQFRDCEGPGALAAALVAEGSLDRQGVSKPTDLYFTAGNQSFLKMARKILGDVSRKDLLVGMQGPWSYGSKLPSMMWDVTDDRVYSLMAGNPAKDKKLTNPGPEALGLLGLSLHPVFAGRNGRTMTLGCTGTWKSGKYAWPLWASPSSLNTVRSLISHAHTRDKDDSGSPDNAKWFSSWGITWLLKSAIRRSSQGGYGTFGPPEVVWSRSSLQ